MAPYHLQAHFSLNFKITNGSAIYLTSHSSIGKNSMAVSIKSHVVAKDAAKQYNENIRF